MKIIATPDNTGIAPRDSRWSAIDSDTYDGAEDSHCPIGWGATEAEAIADLMEKLAMTFAQEDYQFTADLLRQHMNTDRKSFQAVCSNNLSIILAALDRAATATERR